MQIDSSPNEWVRAVKRALRNENWKKAERLASRAFNEGLAPRRFTPAFAAVGKLELLVHAMWQNRDVLFKDLGTIASFAKTVSGMELAEQYLPKLQRWTGNRIGRSAVVRHRDYLLTYRDLDERALASLFQVKYGAWNLDCPDGPLQEAARHADSFQVEPETAAFFYKHSRANSKDLSAWLEQFKITQLLHHLFADGHVSKRFRRDPDVALRDRATKFSETAGLQRHLDIKEAKRVFQGLDRSQGLLLSTFHGGFLRISSFFFVTAMPEPHWVTTRGGENVSHIISVRDNERAAAFQIVKTLSQGKAVLMAPDGPYYGSSSAATIEVLGLKTTISHGAAFMAYEANSDTGWISAVRQGDMFVPEFVPGPRRRKGEIYSNFRDRWLAFYAERLNCALSSGPENLIPFSRWAEPYSKWWN